jgi:hypothetical protein
MVHVMPFQLVHGRDKLNVYIEIIVFLKGMRAIFDGGLLYSD